MQKKGMSHELRAKRVPPVTHARTSNSSKYVTQFRPTLSTRVVEYGTYMQSYYQAGTVRYQ